MRALPLDHRNDPLRRHRRHRHVGHRRGAAQSRLQGAGQRHRRRRQHAPAARARHQGRDRPSRRQLANAQVVVVSTAVKKDNPEVLAARARLLPVVRRAEMLGELMRLKWSIAIGGTHGKTTTTSMVAAMLDAGGLDPDRHQRRHHQRLRHQCPAGRRRLDGGRGRTNRDGSFLRLPATIAVVTNIDPEHLDHYGTFDALRDAFVRFVENIPFYGFAVLCIDHPEVQALIPRVADRRIITYGFGANADVRAINLRLDRSGADFDVMIDEPRDQRIAHHRRPAPADVRPAQCAERAGRHRRGPGDGPARRRPSAGRWPASAASSAASPRPARRTASR